MIGTHNSMTYLKPRYSILSPFAFLWRTQTKNINEQYRAGARYFDIRVRWDKKHKTWRFCHGLTDLACYIDNLASIRRLGPNTSDKRFRLLLERGSKAEEKRFIEATGGLDLQNDMVSFIGIKKNWNVIYNKDPMKQVDHSFTPFLSGLSFSKNIKRFFKERLYTTIRGWKRKHPVTVTSELIKSRTLHFVDLL